MITCLPVRGIGEVRPGDDIAAEVVAAASRSEGLEDGLRDGDVLVVTSKVVSKAEGLAVPGTREDALAGETDRVVARRGPTSIVRTRHGLVMAAAGIDASNTAPGTVVLLPRDPDASARRLREELAAGGGCNVAVLVTDTAGRAWREGQTDIAIGAAGLQVLDDHAGRVDAFGNELAVTAPALADEIAGAADLVAGKLSGVPAVVVRGLAHLVLPAGEHGPGAGALVRAETHDMFGLGSREAVVAALLRDDQRGFGGPAPAHEVISSMARVVPGAKVISEPPAVLVHPGADEGAETAVVRERLTTLGFALGWREEVGPPDLLRFVPRTP